MMKNIKAIIFDFDGVIVDSEPIRLQTYAQIFLEEFNTKISIPKNDFIGRKPKENLNKLLEMYGLEGDIGVLLNKRKELIFKAFSNEKNIKPIDGLNNILKVSKKSGLKLAIASSSDTAYLNLILSRLNLPIKFDVITSSDNILKGKPDPQIFIVTAEKLGISPKECLVIEDSLNGIEAGKKAGMTVIAITTSINKEKLTTADKIIDSLDELCDFI